MKYFYSKQIGHLCEDVVIQLIALNAKTLTMLKDPYQDIDHDFVARSIQLCDDLKELLEELQKKQ